jgi:hypothetical protein
MSYHNGPRTVTDGLVLYLDAGNTKSYPGAGTSWNDLSGNNNSTLVNGPTYSSSNAGIITFDGTNDYVRIPFNSIFNVTSNPFSVIIWNKKNDNSSVYNGLITANSNGDSTWRIERNVNTNFYTTRSGSSTLNFPNFTVNQWHFYGFTKSGTTLINYFDGVESSRITNATDPSSFSNDLALGSYRLNDAINGNYLLPQSFGPILFYNRSLSASEILQNYNAIKARFNSPNSPDGTLQSPFTSPAQAQSLGYADGTYYFFSGTMASARLLEFKNNFYENKSWVCVFRSPYNSTATTNQLGFNIPMRGLLVQRDSLDIRGAVYWSSPITYNAVGGIGNNTADSGYSPRRVILGSAGGHGIYTTGQMACNWPNGLGAIGTGWNGSTCGSFPNGLLWGTGQANTPTYANASGIWSHWTYWE